MEKGIDINRKVWYYCNIVKISVKDFYWEEHWNMKKIYESPSIEVMVVSTEEDILLGSESDIFLDVSKYFDE